MTDPQQDRNVEARASELLPCPFCGGEAEYDSARWNGILPVHSNTGHAIYCTKCPLPGVGGCIQHETRDEAIAAWNSRPSQPPQNVEADRTAFLSKAMAEGDGCISAGVNVEAGVGPYVDSIRCYWQAYRKANGDDEKIIEAFIRDLDRLALSATSSHAVNATGERQREAGELADKLKKITPEQVRDFVMSLSESELDKLATSLNAPFIIAASSNAERLKDATALLHEVVSRMKSDGHVGGKDYCWQCVLVDNINRFLSPAPAQTPSESASATERLRAMNEKLERELPKQQSVPAYQAPAQTPGDERQEANAQ